MFSLKKSLFLSCILGLILSCAFLSGCSYLDKLNEQDPLTMIVVSRGVDEMIQVADDPYDRASKVVRYGAAANARIKNDAVTTFAGLKEVLIDELPDALEGNWLPGEYEAVVLMISNTVDYTRQKAVEEFGEEKADAAVVSISTFLDIAVRTAQRYLRNNAPTATSV